MSEQSVAILPVATRRRESWVRRWQKASPLALIVALCLILFYSVIFVIPFAVSIWLSFQNWDFIVNPVFVGLANYRQALTDPDFLHALRVTVEFSVAEITIAVTLALLVALPLSRLKGAPQQVLLLAYYLPVIMPAVVSILLWRWLLYLPSGGVLNALLESLGLPAQPFLNSPSQALWCIIVMVVWSYLGNIIVLNLAGINDVPESLLEAARLDGASFVQQCRFLILPLLRPVLVYIVVTSVIGTVQMFEQFFLMPGPGNSTRNLAVYTYQLGFLSLNLGYGAAVSLIMFLMLLVATIIQVRRFQSSLTY
jgi:multiple sugar transport system permease protein